MLYANYKVLYKCVYYDNGETFRTILTLYRSHEGPQCKVDYPMSQSATPLNFSVSNVSVSRASLLISLLCLHISEVTTSTPWLCYINDSQIYISNLDFSEFHLSIHLPTGISLVGYLTAILNIVCLKILDPSLQTCSFQSFPSQYMTIPILQLLRQKLSIDHFLTLIILI